MLVTKRSETLLKIILYVGISQKRFAKQYVQNAPPDDKYGHIDMKTIRRGEPKDRNIETE